MRHKIILLLECLTIALAQDFHSVEPPTHFFSIVPPANVESQIAKVNGSRDKGPANSEFCPSLENADLLTDEEFFEHLVHPCRYDRIQRPKLHDDSGKSLPVNVYVRSFIYYLQNLDTHDLQFKMQTLLQMRFVDPRLAFKAVAPKRIYPVTGEEDLRKKIWVPHVFFSNERDSGVLGTYGHHILTSISPDGTVIISSRLQATLFCPMDLRKFPFDSQECKATLECWMYNASQVQLHWEKFSPLTMGPDKILTEYILTNTSTTEEMVIANENDLRHGAFVGNYSSIIFKFKVDRQAGFYILEYYLPSVMIVGISWVSFYLQADQTAPRAMLGASAMLAFITLSSAQNKILPKVSYIKALEIWSMACTAFIFMSLVEFAFVNVIWRRRKHVELKKVNATNILKHTLTAKDVRTALGIDTSRSVASIPSAVQNDEEFLNDKTRIDKRSSVDFASKIQMDGFTQSISMHRSNSCTDLNELIKRNVHNSNDFIVKANNENDESFKKFNNLIHSSSISHQNGEKKTLFEENILMNDDHLLKNISEKKSKFDKLPRIESETSLNMKNKVKFDDSECRVRRKSYMVPVILTEGQNGEYEMEMDTSNAIRNNSNAIEIIIKDDDSDAGSLGNKIEDYSKENLKKGNHLTQLHHTIYDGWTRMTPHELSNWIDKRSRTFFPFSFAVFNVFYWTFVYLF
ncbi:hypothetical protein ACKWTF_001605 [Chironomus riparius]